MVMINTNKIFITSLKIFQMYTETDFDIDAHLHKSVKKGIHLSGVLESHKMESTLATAMMTILNTGWSHATPFACLHLALLSLVDDELNEAIKAWSRKRGKKIDRIKNQAIIKTNGIEKEFKDWVLLSSNCTHILDDVLIEENKLSSRGRYILYILRNYEEIIKKVEEYLKTEDGEVYRLTAKDIINEDENCVYAGALFTLYEDYLKNVCQKNCETCLCKCEEEPEILKNQSVELRFRNREANLVIISIISRFEFYTITEVNFRMSEKLKDANDEANKFKNGIKDAKRHEEQMKQKLDTALKKIEKLTNEINDVKQSITNQLTEKYNRKITDLENTYKQKVKDSSRVDDLELQLDLISKELEYTKNQLVVSEDMNTCLSEQLRFTVDDKKEIDLADLTTLLELENISRVVICGYNESWRQSMKSNLNLLGVTAVTVEPGKERDILRQGDSVILNILSYTHTNFYKFISSVRSGKLPLIVLSQSNINLCIRKLYQMIEARL